MKGPAEEKTEPDADEKKKEAAKKEAAKDAPPKKAEEAPAPKKKDAEPKTPEGGKLKDEVYDDIRSVEASSAAAETAAKVVEGANKETVKAPEKKEDDPAPEAPAAFAQKTKGKKMQPGEAIDIPGFSPYDVTHDMVGKGVWKATAMDDPNPVEDKKILAR